MLPPHHPTGTGERPDCQGCSDTWCSCPYQPAPAHTRPEPRTTRAARPPLQRVDALTRAGDQLAHWVADLAAATAAGTVWLPELERNGPTAVIIDRLNATADQILAQLTAGRVRAIALKTAARAAQRSLHPDVGQALDVDAGPGPLVGPAGGRVLDGGQGLDGDEPEPAPAPCSRFLIGVPR